MKNQPANGKRYYDRLRREGKCVRCRKKALKGHSTCSYCRIKRMMDARERTQQRILHSLCQQCGDKKPLGRAYCDRCASMKTAAAGGHLATLQDRKRLFELQGGYCGICTTELPGLVSKNTCVDHDHKTGELRGLLCNKCNRGLGHFSDDVSLVYAAYLYLLSPAPKLHAGERREDEHAPTANRVGEHM